MGTINIQSTDLSHKAGLTYTGTSDKTIDVDSLVTKVSSTDNAIARFDGTGGAIQNSSVYIDDSGNVGIGTSSPTAKLHISSGTQFDANSAKTTSNLLLQSTGTAGADAYGGAVTFCRINSSRPWGAIAGVQYSTDADQGGLSFLTHGSATTNDVLSERMRIDSSGNMLVGATSALSSSSGGKVQIVYSGGSSAGNGLLMRPASDNGAAITFLNAAASQVGYIYTTSTATQYNTSSDYRLKEDYQDMTGATDRLKALKPINFAWKVDGSRVDGFLAHELQEVVPEAATGTKDAMRDEEYEVTPAAYETVEHPAVEATYDEEGNQLTPAFEAYTEKVLVAEAVMGTRQVPDYQGIDQSKLVPLLTKALQEAVEKIEQLTTRIEALEAK